jgi:hypothetical protein
LNCPFCNAKLELALVASSAPRPQVPDLVPEQSYESTIGGRRYRITRADILAARPQVKRAIRDYYVEIEGKRYQAKDLVRQAILLKAPDFKSAGIFTTAYARRILENLGFRWFRL